MIFITGPYYSGKRAFARALFGWSEEELAVNAVLDAQKLAENEDNLEALADRLSAHPVVIAVEVGGGVVPMDPLERKNRERAGRLACLLAARAETAVRMCCGLPEILKGELPCG
ncbi:MAG: bifunctional adenosylcobinamide kinase/adenosylcobinamide-phosphate guanylyltransferase [Lachnospiraceae bacterium]|nr:bifunctional adenosylcobinamide kinase/adenosylcobinamide-phosphate guanylyltransferase [Lachnospiraceae bacterium]